MCPVIRPWIGWAIYLAVLLVCVLGLLETAYRCQWIDAYAPELSRFNAPQDLHKDARPAVLTMGDSFTAGNQSYPAHLRTAVPHWRVINAGVSGSGIFQALQIAPRRFEQCEPRLFIYQIYVGNDLIDVAYHPNWRQFSLARNLWWTLTRYVTVVPYLRYRLTQLTQPQQSQAGSVQDSAGINVSETFSVQQYTPRIPLYYMLEPDVVQNSILLKGVRAQDFRVLTRNLTKLVAYCKPPLCRTYVLVMPHKAQVGPPYFAWERKLGARLDSAPEITQDEYPFVQGLRRDLARTGVVVLNPLPYLKREEVHRLQRLYYVNDDHLTPEGHRALTAYLLEQIAELRGR